MQSLWYFYYFFFFCYTQYYIKDNFYLRKIYLCIILEFRSFFSLLHFHSRTDANRTRWRSHFSRITRETAYIVPRKKKSIKFITFRVVAKNNKRRMRFVIITMNMNRDKKKKVNYKYRRRHRASKCSVSRNDDGGVEGVRPRENDFIRRLKRFPAQDPKPVRHPLISYIPSRQQSVEQ